MKFKNLGFLNVTVKSGRGLAFNRLFHELRPEIFKVAARVAEEFITLKPGQETEVLVDLSEVPKNADLKMITATLLVNADLEADRSERTSVEITRTVLTPRATGEGVDMEVKPTESYDLNIDMPNRPRNIEIKLDRGSVFWTFAGTLQENSYAIPDFALQANEYLDKAQFDDDKVKLRFLVKSDTNGKIKIEIDKQTLDYSLLQTQAWENPLDETIRMDRNYQLDFCTIQKLPIDFIAGQADQAKSIKSIRFDVGGQFESERVLGSFQELTPQDFCTISSEFSLCQSFTVNNVFKLSGLSGYMQSEAEAEIYLEIQADLNNSPASGPPLAKTTTSILANKETEEKSWISIKFEETLDVVPDMRYWIVLRGIRGKTLLGLEPLSTAGSDRILLNRGGQIWKEIRSVTNERSALLRLIYIPEADNQSAALEIGLEETDLTQRIDPGKEAQSIILNCEGILLHAPVLQIKSYARGSLSIANIVQDYVPSS